MAEPGVLRLAVIGHTNVGKTSLLRTLAEDVDFGEVSPRPGTTRHVERVRLRAGNHAVLELFDTPGLEDAMALLAYIEQNIAGEFPRDGVAQLERFLQSTVARQRFEQEAKVLRQILASDAALYLADAREPVLECYKDELELLRRSGKPLVPVLNFSGHENTQNHDWLENLARLGLHVVVRFDTVSPPEDGEQRLYESLALQLPKFRNSLQHLLDDHAARRAVRQQAALEYIANLLLDAAAVRKAVKADADQAGRDNLQELLRQREQSCVEQLLAVYAFRRDDAHAGELPVSQGRWEYDLFSKEALAHAGLTMGKGAATGALIGAGIDILTGGLSLGTGTLLGTTAGGLFRAANEYGTRALDRIRGYQELTVDDGVLRILQQRQLQLLLALQQRGHAARERIVVMETGVQAEMPRTILQRARSRPLWSSLNEEHEMDSGQRDKAVAELAGALAQLLEAMRTSSGKTVEESL